MYEDEDEIGEDLAAIQEEVKRDILERLKPHLLDGDYAQIETMLLDPNNGFGMDAALQTIDQRFPGIRQIKRL